MRKIYRDKASIKIDAEDATYWVDFAEESDSGEAWEFDLLSDAHMTVERKTGNIRVRFLPDPDTMSFPEDIKRKMQYILPVGKARELYKIVKGNVNFWFALDMASIRCN